MTSRRQEDARRRRSTSRNAFEMGFSRDIRTDASEGSESAEDDDDDETMDVNETSEALELPALPFGFEGVLKERKYGIIEEYLRSVTVLSRFCSRNYLFYVVFLRSNGGGDGGGNRNDELEHDDPDFVLEVHDYVFRYFMGNSRNPAFTKVFPCKLDGEDMPRKTCLRSHLFWELCRLTLVAAKCRENEGICYDIPEESSEERRRRSSSHAKAQFRKCARILGPSGILPPDASAPADMSQRELNQALFLLSSKWKTVEYCAELSFYVNSLLLRMCEFFCYSMGEDEMDDPDLRQPIPSNALSSRSSSTNVIEKKQYGPNLDYLMMCQIRFYHFSSDLTAYETREKTNLRSAVAKYRERVVRSKTFPGSGLGRARPGAGAERLVSAYGGGGGGGSNDTKRTESYDAAGWVSSDLIKRFCAEAFENVAPEQKERTSSRYVYCAFSEADRDWLLYKKPVSLPSFADHFVCKECKDAAYDEVISKAQRAYPRIMEEDSKDPSMAGFYDWCVLKTAARLFALSFDIFEDITVHREDLRDPERTLFLFQYEKPVIVQFFSRYQVFYKGTLFDHDCDEEFEFEFEEGGENARGRTSAAGRPGVDEHPRTGRGNEKSKSSSKRSVSASASEDLEAAANAIYDTILLWACIMLKDFPKSDKSKGIEECMKRKFAEYSERDRKAYIEFGEAGEPGGGNGGVLGNGRGARASAKSTNPEDTYFDDHDDHDDNGDESSFSTRFLSAGRSSSSVRRGAKQNSMFFF